ncbi:hypothetical protein C6P08_03940 [Weissella confusa]|uniref:hypothetical protein n=1 Tax=Weissella confusa TaxID=1583 RepID=UPI00107F09ED|nr:hypothetical protein [Weissella confusa]MBJ7694034.1 hypothetical protein [Weissella confusa]QBZ04383.1 hypothetical protein C6P08_03940 [Weissella confusa]TGE65224.1 hypothetical protein C6P12_04065 [Weissella confusa]
MTKENKLAQIKSLISEYANEASENELSVLLEIAALANTEYNKILGMKKSTSVNNGTQRHLPDAQQQSSEGASIARLIAGIDEIAKEEYNKTTKPDGHEINLADDVKTFVHAVLTDEKTKSNPQLIAAVAELLEFFR